MADIELLVSVAQAKEHLGFTPTTSQQSADLLFKLEQAQDAIMALLRSSDAWQDAYADWTEDTVPRRVQAAILYQLGELWRFHGDDEPQYVPKWEFGQPAAYIQRLLRDLMDPAVA